MAEPTRYPCMRCGDAFALDVTDPYLPDICHSCFQKVIAPLFQGNVPNVRAFSRAVKRYQKGGALHPTGKALVAYYAEHYSAETPY